MTKNVSLYPQIAPLESSRPGQQVAPFTIREDLFDLDTPAIHQRRIRSVAMRRAVRRRFRTPASCAPLAAPQP